MCGGLAPEADLYIFRVFTNNKGTAIPDDDDDMLQQGSH
jgi:hypothetical protein